MRLILLFITIAITQSAEAKINALRAMFNANASNSITIGWNQVSGENPVLLWGKRKSKHLVFEQSNFPDRKVKSKGMHNHFVRLTGLTPNTEYTFVIKDSEGCSEKFFFETVSDQPTTRLSIIAGGDSRSNPHIRVLGNKMVAKLKPHAVFFNGDFTANDTPKQWNSWFCDWQKTIDENGRITPMVVTRGNHEHSNATLVDLFDVPSSKVYYNVTFGGTLLNVVNLNSEIWKFLGQKSFLKKTLKKHNHFYWQVPQYHRPIRAHVSYKKEMETQYKNFVPLFERHSNVRLCLENDSHTAKITWPIIQCEDQPNCDEGFIRNDVTGIVYAGEGCWGAPLRAADDAKSWTRDCASINQIQWLFIDQEKIELRTILYENAEKVSSLSLDNRFEMPKGIELWNPTNGSVVYIMKNR